MGLDWGFQLEGESVTIDLISFCGRNSTSIMKRLSNLSESGSFDEHQECVIPLKELFIFGSELEEIENIFHNVSARCIENQILSDETCEKFADLTYNLGVDNDFFTINTLLNLNLFIKFLKRSDIFGLWNDNDRNYELVLWGSW